MTVISAQAEIHASIDLRDDGCVDARLGGHDGEIAPARARFTVGSSTGSSSRQPRLNGSFYEIDRIYDICHHIEWWQHEMNMNKHHRPAKKLASAKPAGAMEEGIRNRVRLKIDAAGRVPDSG